MKPFKDMRFSIAVFDYGEYSYRSNKSTLTPEEALGFILKYMNMRAKQKGACKTCGKKYEVHPSMLDCHGCRTKHY